VGRGGRVGDAVDDGGAVLDGWVGGAEWVVVVVVGDGVVVVVVAGCVVAVAGGGGGGTGTVDVPVLPFESVVVMTDGDGAGVGSVGEVGAGLVLSPPTVRASTTASVMAARAAATLRTRAVRLYHGSGPGWAA
jgi:hypothetical protein